MVGVFVKDIEKCMLYDCFGALAKFCGCVIEKDVARCGDGGLTLAGGPAVVGAGAPVDGRRGDSGSGEPGLIPSDGSGAPDFDGHVSCPSLFDQKGLPAIA